MRSNFRRQNQYTVTSFNSSQSSIWRHKAQLQNCKIWENIQTLQIAEAHLIQNSNEIDIHAQRNKQFLIKTKGFCQIDQQTNYILTERVINRLSQCKNLTQSQALKIMYAVFRGLQELLPMFGLIGVNQNCIFFTDESKIKIWINQDVTETTVQINHNTSDGTQKTIIREVIQIIERKCFNQKILYPLKSGIESGKIKLFSHAYKQVFKIANQLFIEVSPNISQKRQSLQDEASQKYSRSSFHSTQGSIKSPYNLKSQKSNALNFQKNKAIQDYANPQTDRAYITNYKVQKTEQSDKKQINGLNKHTRHRSFVENTRSSNKFLMTCPSVYLDGKSNIQNKIQIKIPHTPNQYCQSAPNSPREDNDKNFKKKDNFYVNKLKNRFEQEKIYDKPIVYKKKEEILIVQNRLSSVKDQNEQLYKLSESQKEIEDSFAHNFTIQPKQIQTKGDFQTFGVLDQFSQKKLDNSADRSNSNCFLDLDVESMDREIIKKLQLKHLNRTKNSPKRPSIRLPTLINECEQGQEDFNQQATKQNQNQSKRNVLKTQSSLNQYKCKSLFYEQNDKQSKKIKSDNTQANLQFQTGNFLPSNQNKQNINRETTQNMENKHKMILHSVNKQGKKFTFNPNYKQNKMYQQAPYSTNQPYNGLMMNGIKSNMKPQNFRRY